MIISTSAPRQGGKDTVGKIIQLLTNSNQQILLKQNSVYAMTHWELIDLVKKDVFFPSGSEWQIKKFADKLKEIASLLTGISKADFEKEEVKNSYLPECWNYHPFSPNSYVTTAQMTVREFLQKLGTNAIRDGLHENTWVNALMCNYTKTYIGDRGNAESEHPKLRELGIKQILPTYPNWIITDTRFPNELQAVKDKGGICIRVDRQSVEKGDTRPSETA